MGNTITHYGILGMKWGVRKDNKRGNVKKRKIIRSKDREDVESLIKKDVRELSDKELNTVLNRLGAEDRYRQMISPKSNKQQQQKGRSWVKKTLDGALGLASVAASKMLYDAGKKWAKDFAQGFARGYERSSVERAVAEELRRRSTQLMVIKHSCSQNENILGTSWAVR